ncbi:hypothetical protein VNI00_012882 [Paramarasmius palmivorus]|uniref:Uncharacterized protein n=1 Tax=Paramarasmius palmivorus TaxID=297713 RepID=A0AAW0BZZ9_9AGAR
MKRNIPLDSRSKDSSPKRPRVHFANEVLASTTMYTSSKRQANIRASEKLTKFFKEKTEDPQTSSQQWLEDLCRDRGVEPDDGERTQEDIGQAFPSRSMTYTGSVVDEPVSSPQALGESQEIAQDAASHQLLGEEDEIGQMLVKDVNVDDDVRRPIENNNAAILDLESRLAQEESKNHELARQLTAAEEAVADHDTKLTRLESELASVREEFVDAGKMREAAQNEAHRLGEEVGELKRDFTEFKRKLAQLADS